MPSSSEDLAQDERGSRRRDDEIPFERLPADVVGDLLSRGAGSISRCAGGLELIYPAKFDPE